jgi:hypothetical protein
MRIPLSRAFVPLFLTALPALAWSPDFHEMQTTRAMKLLPEGMASFLATHQRDLMTGARGQSNDQVPTVETVEDQFRKIVELSEERKRPERIARELGLLAHQVQLLMDPSALQGTSPLREAFMTYGDEKLPRLALSLEPFWSIKAPLDPRPRLLQWARTKYERHEALAGCFDSERNRRIGTWDELSVPFAMLQLSFSNGINATANIWIQLWRAVGDEWDPPQEEPPSSL